MLYAAMAAALFFLFDREQAGDDMLNACRPSMDYVHGYSYGRNGYDREELKRAVAYYQTLLLTNPRMPFVYANLGFCYFYLHDPDKATWAYRVSTTMASYVYTAYFDLGFIAMSRGDYAQAARYFEKSRSLVPRNREEFLDVLKINPKYYSEPLVQMDSILFKRIAYDLHMIYAYLGSLYVRMKDYPRLEALSDEGRVFFGQDPEMYYYGGLVKFNAGALKEALVLFTQALVVAPDYADAYSGRARIWQMTGNVSRYRADMDKYQELKKAGEWKRPHDILDLHHWHDAILFFQMYK